MLDKTKGKNISKPYKGPKAKSPYDPYIAGRNEWNERYGSIVRHARIAWGVAACAILVALASITYGFNLAAQATIVPYVIEVDATGTAMAAGPAQKTQFKQDLIVDAELGRFVRNWRTVTVDSRLQRSFIDTLYSRLSGGDPAQPKMNDFFREEGNSPFSRAALETVTINVGEPINITPTSYQVDWTETSFNREGLQTSRRQYRAILTIKIIEPKTAAAIRANPLGIFITDVDYSEV